MVPVVDDRMPLVTRHVATDPTANGPNALVQSTMSPVSARTLAPSRALHADGSLVMHWPTTSAVRQSYMVVPSAIDVIPDTRHDAALPAAYTPRSVVHVTKSAASEIRLESVESAEQAVGSAVIHTEAEAVVTVVVVTVV